jgi:hypothetical protein
MAAGATYVPIATTTLGSATGSYTFSSIPQTYTDLVLVAQPIASAGVDLELRFNGDSGTNYSCTQLTGTGSSAISGQFSNSTQLRVDKYGYINTSIGTMDIVNFMNYSNTTTYKTVLSRTGNAGQGTDAVVGLWRSTAAITSIVLYPGATSGATFSAGSTFTLYGIASA